MKPNVVNVIPRFNLLLPPPTFFRGMKKESLSEKIFKIAFLCHSHITIEERTKKKKIKKKFLSVWDANNMGTLKHIETIVSRQVREFLWIRSCLKTMVTPPKRIKCTGVFPASYRGCQYSELNEPQRAPNAYRFEERKCSGGTSGCY